MRGETFHDLDQLKRKLAITQFRNKLIDHFKKFKIESVLTGVSHHEGTKTKNINRILAGIEKIQEIPSENRKTVTKILVLGVKANSCVRPSTACIEFLLPQKFFNENIKLAKFLLAVPGRRGVLIRWQIDLIIGRMQIATFNIKSRQLQVGIHEIECTNILQLFFSKYNQTDGKKILKLGLRVQYNGKGFQKPNVYIRTIILLASMASAKRRYPRAAVKQSPLVCTSSSIFCCMKNFTVTPTDLGLQNLISPDLIHLNYCKGDCNHYSPYRSKHASYLSMLKRSKTSLLSARQLETMKNCCTPVFYNKLQIQYRDYTQDIRNTEVNDMIVESCGCN
uniref:Activin 1 n=1 Tax=Schmidtea mediterranea TaxID=79327 RepID=U3RA98_SCHMD|nr:activin 1 [Schmidtea mediterranea]